MKILSYHPLYLYSYGGGARILRRLYKGHEDKVIGFTTIYYSSKYTPGAIKETVYKVKPTYQSWMKSYLRTIVYWSQYHTFLNYNKNRIKKKALTLDYDILHVVDHGPFSATLSDLSLKKTVWTSFHDHFSTAGGSFENTQKLWLQSTRRLVISEQMGVEYQRLFGEKEFEIITDGVNIEENAIPFNINKSAITIYFAGLLHHDYLPLFEVLATAIDKLIVEKKYHIRVVLRGTQQVKYLNNRLFETIYNPASFDDVELRNELNSASILYLPIKFTVPDFYLYSLSTKMIGYLGASGSILYHGPDDSAACKLLKSSKAAVCCNSLNVDDLTIAIEELIDNSQQFSRNAKELAKSKFDMEKIKERFWQLNT
ncbi:hypothetical protein [Mucilaginibacter sp. L196]|uniref:hypothetical protein n=1 Tax=Mucilaginibacter sp. L196 TaxID=1641870 RepID=UPI00131DF484|nr:hypothetical protein [Mucilaginibacter sp. L196]